MSLNIIQLFIPNSLRNFNYILYSEDKRRAVIFDPYEASHIIDAVKEHKLEVIALINTHAHHDHIRHNEKILEYFDCPHVRLSDGEVFHLSDQDYIKALYTPGHIDPHFVFEAYSNTLPWGLISGDLLFNAGVGNCKNGGDVEVLYQTITEVISKLPDELLLFPSHDYFLTNLKFSLSIEEDNQTVVSLIEKREKQILDEEFIQTNLKMEREINPFLRLEKLKTSFKNKSAKEIFIELRSKRDKW